MVYLDLLKGDCLTVMKDLSANSIDCFICDLPYGCLETKTKTKEWCEKYNRKPGEGCYGGAAWDVKLDLDKFWEQVKRLCKTDNTPILMFCNTKFGIDLINSNPKWFRYDLVWDKDWGTSFLTANKAPLRSHEMVYVFAKNGAWYNRVDVKGEYNFAWKAQNRTTEQTQRTVRIGGDGNWKAEANDGTTRCVKSVIRIKKNNHFKGTHPTEKPMELYKFLIERYCPKGGTVLDPTAGSFNSCFAAYEMNRNAIGIEMNDAFYEKACKKADTL